MFNSEQLVGNGFYLSFGAIKEKFIGLKNSDIIIISKMKNIQFEKDIENK